MREKSKKQLPLMHLTSDHPQARELEAIVEPRNKWNAIF
jgi:hypothetical protein